MVGYQLILLLKTNKKIFVSINMGIASPGVIYHFTAFPEDYAGREINELVRNIINASFQKMSRKS
ncbi:MAG: hypothetical protein KJ697_04780 [Nanoarchaeota archaeon]|nr:hypothetical protein [Nanoarchaeota archaeon]